MGLVRIASTPKEFARGIEASLGEDPVERRMEAAEFLNDISWDKTFGAMRDLITSVISEPTSRASVAG